MNLVSPTRLGISTAVLGGLVLTMGAVGFRAKADVWDKKTILTIDQPIQVEDTYLEPGTYVFKLLNSDSNRHIVQIYDRDQKHMISMTQAIPNYRIQPTGKSRFMFYETPSGSVRAMRAWFYPGDNYGQEFRYPKQLRQVAFTKTTTDTVARTSVEEPTPSPVVKEREITNEVAAAEPAPVAEPEKPVEEPVIVAQNTTPAPAAQPETAPAPAPVTTPTELPKTATLFPLIGLSGLLSLAGYAWLKRSTA